MQQKPVIVVLDTALMEGKLEQVNLPVGFDHGWLIALAIGMWDHAQSYPDAEEDLRCWLRMRVPRDQNDAICQLAASMGASYEVALSALCDHLVLIVLELVDCVEYQYSRILGGFVYDGGWTISSICFFGESVILRYDRTYIKDILSAQESLLFRLDQLYRPHLSALKY